jgi:hypothetical protein
MWILKKKYDYWWKKYGLEKTDRATKTLLFDRNWAISLKSRQRSPSLRLVWWALPTQFFSCQKKFNQNYKKKKQQTIISNLCKMFLLLSHKHYLIPSLLIDIMIRTSLIKKNNIYHLDIKSLVIKRCHHGISV